MHIGLQVFVFYQMHACMREVEILIYFILRCFYRERCWRPWLLLFALLLFFSLLSKYYIIAIIIVLLLRSTRDYHRRIISKVQQIASWARDVIEFARRLSSSNNPTYFFINLTMTQLWRNICPYILSSRLLCSHPSFVFMYHVMIDNNCTLEDVY